ncbi:MAG: hypothetical protein WA081_20040 [Desulfosalsimonadaceae bacterium]
MKKITLFLIGIAVCFVLTGCDEKYTISENIPDAENAVFTSTGRLFVTGGTNIYEIDGDGTASSLCEEGKYNFTGMAQVGNCLYAVATEYRFDGSVAACGSLNVFSPTAVADFVGCIADMFKRSVLLCAEIVPGDLSFTEIYTMQNALIPNGMVADTAGRLYIADETFLPVGKIIRLTLAGPMSVSRQETWLDASNKVYSPNGMDIRGNKIYFTDFNLWSFKQASVKTVSIGANGSPGAVAAIFERTGLFDDLAAGTVYGTNVVAVADFLKGTVVGIKDNGVKQSSPLAETDLGLFASPSSVTFGKGPNYTGLDLIVTEKGMMFEHYSDFGNRVSGMVIE